MLEFFSAVVRKLSQVYIYSHTRHTVTFYLNAEEGELRKFSLETKFI